LYVKNITVPSKISVKKASKKTQKNSKKKFYLSQLLHTQKKFLSPLSSFSKLFPSLPTFNHFATLQIPPKKYNCIHYRKNHEEKQKMIKKQNNFQNG